MAELGNISRGEVEKNGGGLFLTSSDEELMARALDLEKETRPGSRSAR